MKRIILILSFIIILGIIIVFLIVNPSDKDDTFKIADGMIKIELKSGNEIDVDVEHANIFTTYDNFSKYFSSNVINEKMFISNNYAVVALSYDECKYTNVIPTKYNIVDNNINITAYHDGYSTCNPLYAYYAIKVDKNITELNVNIKWIARNS